MRLYAAAWTAAVAAIPAYIAAGTGTIAGEWIIPERIPLTLLAILAAGISGYWIGWRLIDPSGENEKIDNAALLGTMAAATGCASGHWRAKNTGTWACPLPARGRAGYAGGLCRHARNPRAYPTACSR